MAIAILAWLLIIDAVAVANVQAVGRAKPPNRVLHEPRKHPRKPRVKGAGVDLEGDLPDDLGTAPFAIAAWAIRLRKLTASWTIHVKF